MQKCLPHERSAIDIDIQANKSLKCLRIDGYTIGTAANMAYEMVALPVKDIQVQFQPHRGFKQFGKARIPKLKYLFILIIPTELLCFKVEKLEEVDADVIESVC